MDAKKINFVISIAYSFGGQNPCHYVKNVCTAQEPEGTNNRINPPSSFTYIIEFIRLFSWGRDEFPLSVSLTGVHDQTLKEDVILQYIDIIGLFIIHGLFDQGHRLIQG